MKNRAFWVLWILFIIMFLGDLYSTFVSGVELASILEANPLMKYIGFTGIIGLNVLYIWLFWYFYPRAGPVVRYFIISAMFFVVILRIFVIKSNLEWSEVEITVEQAKEIATEQAKQASYNKLVTLVNLPMISNIITFLIWKVDHNVEKK